RVHPGAAVVVLDGVGGRGPVGGARRAAVLEVQTHLVEGAGGAEVQLVPVLDAETVAPEARLGRSAVRSTPALASMSTIRGLFCTTWLGARSPGTAVR